ncbi:protein kinase (plasmid) [Streptomyces sp. NBC_00841]|uniref:protein kinase domain-containing protein n=1 Tax=unclassified Streptomyces TaxID=2593676 RepID=UPI0022547570|nr:MULTISPECIES: protein kinase [unclassified Streptomyces]MCX4537825.1 protein kinase [Streptomyces sp. NBC_01669]WSA05879.1 protein kinase [Streptomyces sp. NBC_00841]
MREPCPAASASSGNRGAAAKGTLADGSAGTWECCAGGRAGGGEHRNLKPVNLFSEAGRGVRICDFGIARAADSTTRLTVTGMPFGTPAYMAPEQWHLCESSVVWCAVRVLRRPGRCPLRPGRLRVRALRAAHLGTALQRSPARPDALRGHGTPTAEPARRRPLRNWTGS